MRLDSVSGSEKNDRQRSPFPAWDVRACAIPTAMPALLVRPIILLVEDSEDDAYFFQRALKRTTLASRFFHVSDGAAAIEYFRNAHAAPDDATQPWPDLVFLDLKLPSFSGFEILGWLREQAYALPEIEVLSGSEQQSDVDRALELGATAYSVKPVSSDQLAKRLRTWLDQRVVTRPADSLAQRAV